MEVLLIRFHQVNGTRRFMFDCIGADRSKTRVIVSADVSLARKYDIRLQELPLLCRRLLDTMTEGGLTPSITFTEDNMVAVQKAARDAAEKKPHKPPRPSPAAGQAWRHGYPVNDSKTSAAPGAPASLSHR